MFRVHFLSTLLKKTPFLYSLFRIKNPIFCSLFRILKTHFLPKLFSSFLACSWEIGCIQTDPEWRATTACLLIKHVHLLQVKTWSWIPMWITSHINYIRAPCLYQWKKKRKNKKRERKALNRTLQPHGRQHNTTLATSYSL